MKKGFLPNGDPDFDGLINRIKSFKKQLPKITKKVGIKDLKKIDNSVNKMIKITEKGLKK